MRESLRPSRERLWYLDVRACSMRGALEIKCERRQYWKGAGGHQPIGWWEGPSRAVSRAGCQPIVVPPLVPWQHPGGWRLEAGAARSAPWNCLAVGLGAPSGGAPLHGEGGSRGTGKYTAFRIFACCDLGEFTVLLARCDLGEFTRSMVGSAGTCQPAARRSQACRRARVPRARRRGAPAATPRPRQQPLGRAYAGGGPW